MKNESESWWEDRDVSVFRDDTRSQTPITLAATRVHASGVMGDTTSIGLSYDEARAMYMRLGDFLAGFED